MTTPLPPSSDFTSATVTEGGAKTFIAALRQFLADLLGTDGTPVAARIALGTDTAVQSQSATAFTTGGSGTAFTLTPTPAITANAAKQRFNVTIHTNPGASPTLAVSGQTALNFKYRDSTNTKQFITSSVAPSGWRSDVVNDGTDWVMEQVVVSTVGSADLTARDQIALMNIRLMLNTAIMTGALVQGKQWELATDEWGATSTNEAYKSATPNYYSNNTGASDGTGGQSTVTDFEVSSAYGAHAGMQFVASASGSVVATTASISAVTASDTYTLSIYTDSSGNPGTLVGSASSGQTINSVGVKTFTWSSGAPSLVSGTTYWAVLSSAGSGNIRVNGCSAVGGIKSCRSNTITSMGSEVNSSYDWVIGITTQNISNSTLIPDAAVSVSTAPTYMNCYFLWKDDSGSAVLGTDLTVELSRDNGTTYTTATLTNIASYDGTYSVIKARADVSAQPSGTSMLCRIKTLNNKAQRVAAPALYAE